MNVFFESVAKFDATRSTLLGRIPIDSLDELLSSKTKQLNDAESQEQNQVAKIKWSEAKLVDIDLEEAKLKQRLDILAMERKEISSSIGSDQEALSQLQASMSSLKEEINKMETSIPLQKKESETMKKMQELLEKNRVELIDFKLFP